MDLETEKDLVSQVASDVINKEMNEIIESEEVEVIEVIEYYVTDSDDPDNTHSLEPTEKKYEESLELQMDTLKQNTCTKYLQTRNAKVPTITNTNSTFRAGDELYPPRACTRQCHLKINQEKQNRIFENYWSAKSDHSRKIFLEKMTRIKPGLNFFGQFPKKEKYVISFYLDTDNGCTEFCRSCFTRIIDERESVIIAVLEEKLRNLYKWKGLLEDKKFHFKMPRSEETEGTSSSNYVSDYTETFSPIAVGRSVFGDGKPPKYFGPVPQCSSLCFLRIKEDEQNRIFKSYWQDATYESRFTFINEMSQIMITNTDKRFMLKFFFNTMKGYQKVCYNCFCFILGEPESVIKVILDDKWREFFSFMCDDTNFNLVKKPRSKEWMSFVNREGKRQKEQGNLLELTNSGIKSEQEIVKHKINDQPQETYIVKEEIDLGCIVKEELDLGCIVKEELDLGCDELEFQLGQGEKTSEIELEKIVDPTNKQNENLTPVLDLNLLKESISIELGMSDSNEEDYEMAQETQPVFSNYDHLLFQDGQEDTVFNKLKKGWTRLSPCKHRCALHVTTEDQKYIFYTYWQNATSFTRFRFINEMVDIIPFNRFKSNEKYSKKYAQKRRIFTFYYLDTQKGRHKVCRACFCTAIDEHPAYVAIALRKKKMSALNEFRKSKLIDEVVIDDDDLPSSSIAEGKVENQAKDQVTVKNLIRHMLKADLLLVRRSKLPIFQAILLSASKEQLKVVEEHINKFPLCESHNFNDLRSGKCLPMGLTVEIAYHLYRTEVLNPVDFDTYEGILEHRDLKFKPEFLGKCEICHYTAQYAKKYPNVRNVITSIRSSHLADFQEALISKSQDLNIKARPYLICTFGYQQSLPTPSLSNPKAFYKQPLWTYNFVVQELVKSTAILKNSNFYMWHEAVGKKTENEMASCLYQYLKDLPRHIKTVVFYSSSCNGKSRSKTIAMMFTHLIYNHKTLECIDHKFLIDGHSVVEDNTETSWTAKIVRKHLGKVEQPKDWYDAFTEPLSPNINPKVMAMTPDMFYDFESLGNDVFKGYTSCIDDKIKWLRFTNDGIFYKNTLSRTGEFKNMDEKLHPQSNDEIRSICKKIHKKTITPMTIERKKDLLDLVNLMPPVLPEVKKFYAAILSRKEFIEPSTTKRKLKEIVQEKNDTLSWERCIVKEEVDLENYGFQSLIEEDEPPKKIRPKKIDEIDFISFEQVSVKEENIEESPRN